MSADIYIRDLMLIFILLFSIIITGCAYIQSEPVTVDINDIEIQIDQWVEDKKYGTALTALNTINGEYRDDAMLLKKKNEILRTATQYAEEITRKGKELEEEGRLGDAEILYAQGMSNYPQSTIIIKAHQQLQVKQNEKLKTLTIEAIITDAIWLEKSLMLQNEIFRIKSPTWITERQYNEQQQKAKDIAKELASVGVAALKENNLQLAVRTIPLAYRLHPTSEYQQLDHKLTDIISREQKKIKQADIRATEKSKKEQQDALLEELTQAIEGFKLAEAQQLISRLEKDKSNIDIAIFDELQQRLNQIVSSKIEKHLAQGIEMYSEGKYQEAIDIWREVLVLDPTNEQLNTHIERAERVIAKLQQLREKQTPGDN